MLPLAFDDYEKVFSSLEKAAAWNVIQQQGVEETCSIILVYIYKKDTAIMKL